MYNPFYDIVKADELTPRLVAELFIEEASPIWSHLQYPVNHLVIGPRGAGKTIALRQLDHKSRRSERQPSYIGTYIQISKISTIFQNVFSADDPSDHFQRVFSDYLWLEILKEVASFIRSPDSHIDASNPSTISRITNGVIDAKSAESLEEQCADLQKKIEESIHRWSINKQMTWHNVANLPASLDRLASVLRKLCPQLDQENPSLFLLFDESSPIPVQCQRVINGLLHRGRPYCVKLAIRPYEWSTLTTESNRTIELDTDVKPLHMRYPNELKDGYISGMRSVANRILDTRVTKSTVRRDGWPSNVALDIRTILGDESQDYSGFSAVCATSSGNPQNLLSLCSCIFATAIETATRGGDKGPQLTRMSARTQKEAIVRWSKNYEEQNPYPDSRAFCRSLLKEIRKQAPEDRSIGLRFSHDESDLFAPEYLPADVGRLITSAFSGGFIRNTQRDRDSLFDVPAEFHLSRGLLPREGLSLRLPIQPARELNRDFIRQNAREEGHHGAKRVSGGVDGEIAAFLSTSFARRMEQQRIDIKRALHREQIRCVDLHDLDGHQFLFTSVYRGIGGNAITILDATIVRPYTMLEIGMCANAPKVKNVVCIVNNDDAHGLPVSFPSYMKKLEVLTFSFEEGSLRRLAGLVRSRCEELLAKQSEFLKVEITNTPLRSKRRQQSVFVSLPQRSVRARAIKAIRERLSEVGWTVIVEEDVKAYGANEFQVPIQCAHMSRIGVIDTTGEDGPDLLQCYKLGLFAGRRAPWRVQQVEEEAYARPDTFDSVPGMPYITWNTIDELVNVVERFVKRVK